MTFFNLHFIHESSITKNNKNNEFYINGLEMGKYNVRHLPHRFDIKFCYALQSGVSQQI